MVRVLILTVVLMLCGGCIEREASYTKNTVDSKNFLRHIDLPTSSLTIVDFEHNGYRYTIATRHAGGVTLLHKEKIEGE